jgi:hypothetical protein
MIVKFISSFHLLAVNNSRCSAVENDLGPAIPTPNVTKYSKLFHVFSLKIGTEVNHLYFLAFSLNNL